MFRFLMLLPIAALLSGCWWDDAPELYKVTVGIVEVGAEIQSKEFICDFRGQTATRICQEQFFYVDNHLRLVPDARAQKPDAVAKALDLTPVLQELSLHMGTLIEVKISAHGRKDDRYMIAMNSPGGWYEKNRAQAKNEFGDNVFITSDAELRDGWKQPLIPREEVHIRRLTEIYNQAFVLGKAGIVAAREVKGLKDFDARVNAITLQAVTPYKPAAISVTWEPIDEEDITRSDNVS